MKSIEERAREWAEEQLQGHRDYATMSDKVKKVWRENYINDYCHIATEQKDIDDKLYEDALQTTHTPKGVTKKELLELLINYPDDAIVVVECCNVRKLSYSQKDNTIRID